jgi:hypothetical protein
MVNPGVCQNSECGTQTTDLYPPRGKRTLWLCRDCFERGVFRQQCNLEPDATTGRGAAVVPKGMIHEPAGGGVRILKGHED